jgi:hypothetical protein
MPIYQDRGVWLSSAADPLPTAQSAPDFRCRSARENRDQAIDLK